MSWLLDRNGSKSNHWYRYVSNNHRYELFVILKNKSKTELSVTVSSILERRTPLARQLFRRADTDSSFRSVLGEIKEWATEELETPFARLTRQLSVSL
jgi:hypothetical protein